MRSKCSKCSKGLIKRNSYTKKDGTLEKKAYIKAQPNGSSKTSKVLKEYLSKKSKMHNKVKKIFVEHKCSKGEIIKEGYVIKPYT
jgi:hypothetical protein